MSNNNTPNTTNNNTNNMPKFDTSIENGPMMMRYHQPKFKYPVEVRPAPGKGNGVFATRTIKKGQVCCFYDGILIEPNTWDGFKEGITRLTLLGVLVSGEHGYNQQFDNHSVIAGYPFQTRPGGCAQLCNDVSMDYKTNEEGRAGCNVEEYSWRNKEGRPVMVFKAKRKIKQGEELLYSYGVGYWESQRTGNASADGSGGLFAEKLDFTPFPDNHPSRTFHSARWLNTWQGTMKHWCKQFGVNGRWLRALGHTASRRPNTYDCVIRLILSSSWPWDGSETTPKGVMCEELVDSILEDKSDRGSTASLAEVLTPGDDDMPCSVSSCSTTRASACNERPGVLLTNHKTGATQWICNACCGTLSNQQIDAMHHEFVVLGH